MNSRLFGALLSALLLALSYPLTLLPLPAWLLGFLPFNLPADPALGSFTIPGLPTHLGYLQFPWMAYLGLVPLLLSVRAARKSAEALKLGIVCGVVWLALTMLWLISFGFVPVLLLALYFSLPMGLFTWLAWHLMHLPASPRLQVARLIWGLPLLWTAIEYIRSFGMWGFPWNLLGYTQAAYPMLAQTADIGGVFLVGFFVALVNVVVVTLISNVGTIGTRAAQVALASLLLASAFGYGWWRDRNPGPVTKQKPLSFELVQGGISSREEWDDASYRKSLDAYAGTTRELLGLKQQPATYSLAQSKPQLSNLPPANPVAANQPEIASNPSSDASATPEDVPAKPIKRKGGAPIGDVLVVWPEGALLKRGGFDLDPAGDGAPYEVRQLVEGHPQHAVLWGALGYRPAPLPLPAPVPQVSANGAVAVPRQRAQDHKPVVKKISPPPVAQPVAPARSYPEPVTSPIVKSEASEPQRQPKAERQQAKPRKQKRVHVMSDAERARERRLRLVNGSILTTSEGSTWPYSKIRLVPYGEVTPFRGIVTFLRFPWDFGGVDLNAGREMQPVEWRGHKLGALICFDNLFGFIARREARAGAGYLVVMTNNSWYPMRSGIRQHADIDVLRAIETRRPLVRAATTGWSQVVDRNGRIIKSSEQRVGAPDYVEATLQPGSGATTYMLVGDLFAQLCLLCTLLIVLPPMISGRSEGFL